MEHTLVEKFDIDNGELKGLSPEKCFVLGVEWARFYHELIEAQKEKQNFDFMAHEQNVARFCSMAHRNSFSTTVEIAEVDGYATINCYYIDPKKTTLKLV